MLNEATVLCGASSDLVIVACGVSFSFH